ncbi:hypothetical protein J1N35_043259 [Gossypium stocksii]|uniref:ABC transmembrane type-1 domain-containing protein n=1 Tax=Gossypium stocksii TaxID=47602 RepID=A0A9D3ZEX0_9ROSI|nr:hypothetical protein J1N35_043259 [Gossypium stocksii]
MAPKAHELMHVQEETKEVNVEVVNETLPFYMLFSYADTLDWTLLVLGTFGSIIHGMAQPVGYLLLGKALNAFGDNIADIDAMVKTLKKVVPFVWYMAFATFPTGVLEIGCWMYVSERQMARLRLAFLKVMLGQEIEAFDTEITSGKIISAISYHMSIIQDAIGEKLGHFFSSFATFFFRIFITVICCWEVSLLSLVVAPMILVTGATYTKKMNVISATKTVYISKAAWMVEQTISQIKTVFAFVGENFTAKSFSEILEKQFSLSKCEALIKGVGTDIQIFNQVKAAGYEVFKVIRRKSAISYGSKGKKKVKKIDGNIEIQDVYFAYSSRPEKSILEGFLLSIPTVKMVALVGSSGCGKSTVISLVERFYDPYKGSAMFFMQMLEVFIQAQFRSNEICLHIVGEILIDNYNSKDLDLKFFRKNTGAIS